MKAIKKAEQGDGDEGGGLTHIIGVTEELSVELRPDDERS